jgi:hypothetical protein
LLIHFPLGGGFPGETHSLWNPASEIDDVEEEEVEAEGIEISKVKKEEEDHFMFFTEIAAEVAPAIDRYFPPNSGVRIVAEPGRYFAAAAATLCCSVVSARSSAFDVSFEPSPVNDKEASAAINDMTRQEQVDVVHRRSGSNNSADMENAVFSQLQEELTDYSKLFASQQLAQQEFDVYNDNMNLYEEGYETAVDLLGPPQEHQLNTQLHTVEGMTYSLVAASADMADGEVDSSAMFSLIAAGEAAVKGMIIQAVADSDLQDDYAYYINDGVYGAFNNLMFDHASVRPRILRATNAHIQATEDGGYLKLETVTEHTHSPEDEKHEERELFGSTVFGPTCDSIDVIARSVLLPKLDVGDWMYFQNMGAYTMAAASSFNGFAPSEKFYVCSVHPDYLEGIIAGISADIEDFEEKKTD